MDETLIFVLQSSQSNCQSTCPPNCLPCHMYRPKMIGAIFISDYLVRKVWDEKCLDVLSCKVVVFSTRPNLSPHPPAHNVWDTCEGLRSEEPVWKKILEKKLERVCRMLVAGTVGWQICAGRELHDRLPAEPA